MMILIHARKPLDIRLMKRKSTSPPVRKESVLVLGTHF